MGLKEKVKRELGYMKLGAKRLPKAASKKITGWAKGQYQAAKERAILERRIETEARKAETEAYEEERIRLAKIEARKRARRKAAGRGILAQLGEAGERMGTSNYMFEGLGHKKKRRR